MSAPSLPTVSIVLPILNEEEYIENCVRSLMSNTYQKDKIEILVIDGGSTDNTKKIVKNLSKEDGRVHLLDNPKRLQASGFNIGIKHATGDILIRMDGHAEADSDFIEKNIEVLNEHPDAWCVGGAITSINQTYLGKIIVSAMTCPVGVGNARFRTGNYEGYADTVAFGAYRKQVFENIGLYDENLPRTEDDDLHFRLHKAGGKIYISKKINSRYYPRNSIKNLWRQYFQYGYWRIPTIMKHRQPATVRQIVPVVFVLGWIILIVGAFLWSPIQLLLLAYAGLYILILLTGATLAIRKNGFAIGIATILIFPILHFSYGLGSLAGIWRFVIMRGKGVGPVNKTKITR